MKEMKRHLPIIKSVIFCIMLYALLASAAASVFADDGGAAIFAFSLDENARFIAPEQKEAPSYDEEALLNQIEALSNGSHRKIPIFRLDKSTQLDTPLLSGLYNKGIGKKLLNIDGFAMKGGLSSDLMYETEYSAIDEYPTLYLYRDFTDYQLYRSKGIDPDYSLSGGLKWSTPLDGLVLGGKLSSYRLVNEVTRPDILPWSESAMTFFTNSSKLNAINTAYASAEQKMGDLRLFVEYTRNLYTYEDESVDEHVAEGYGGGMSFRFNDWFELTSHFSIYYADVEDKDGERLTEMGKMAAEAWLKDFALKTEFDVSDNLKIQLEGHLLDGLMGAPDLEDPLWLRYAAKMTLSY